MRDTSKTPLFLIAVRVLVLLYVAALLQLGGSVTCACAVTDAEAPEGVSCCCVGKTPAAVGAKNCAAFRNVELVCCCTSNNEAVRDVQAVIVKFEHRQMFKDTFVALLPLVGATPTSHGAYPAGYHAEVLPFSISSHIATTILLL